MGRKEDMAKLANKLMYIPEYIRNIGIAAHIDHGKTTLSDNLLAGAGLMSEELAGKQLVLDFDEQEQARGITINAANISLAHEYEGKDHLVNLIDTPGHVDFGGDVTRAMRAIDGCIIVVCAVEGKMPQTETVVRQALKEGVKPVLFINKVDRLIKELQLGPEQMQKRFMKIITEVNKLIRQAAPKEFKEKWLVNVNDGSVTFGSAYCNWAISVPRMKKTGITFSDIIKYTNEGNEKELAKKAPVHKVILDMVIKHLPCPSEAQKYRIPRIWKGDVNSEIGKAMMNCDPNSPLGMIVTKIIIDKHAGEIATGRIFSGKVKPGDEVWIVGAKTRRRVQQVGIFMGADRENVTEVPAGNMVALTGLKEAIAGETICGGDKPIHPFEAIKHYSEPVVTEAVEPENPRDLPKLIEVLKQVAKEDPTLKAKIDEETGEYLLSGMGELHLEVVAYRITHEKGVPIKTSEPIVVYREGVSKVSPEVEGKSPNKHNKFYLTVEPLEDEIYKAIKNGEIPEGRVKSKEIAQKLRELGMDKNEAKNVEEIYQGNVYVNMTRGVVHIGEVRELVIEAFHNVVDKGVLTKEPTIKMKVKLHDTKLHEDAIHRGPAQVIPAVRSAIYAAMILADASLYEPIQKVFITAPDDYMGAVTRLLQQKRGQILDIKKEEELTTVVAKTPVAEMFGFASDIRSATEGRALWTTEQIGFEKLPNELQKTVMRQIRQRKGLKPEPPKVSDYV
ncbi:MAG: elongation factor EF-2 [Methanomicrobia archaeon]|nr:elongation factor EF-2 [Methanomicrobia archaeon]